MDVLRGVIKKDPATCIAIGLFVISIVYALANGMAHTVLAGTAFVLILMYGLPHQRAVAFLVGTLVIFLLQPHSRGFNGMEGFEDVSGNIVVASAEEKPVEEKSTEKFSGSAAQKPMMPNNRERQELFELGKPYKLPNEADDKGYHLDAGTTFLNAYKALKPDQIAAMTKDTQELLATQKSLIGMLESFGPLMKDMKQITGFLNN